MIKDLPLTAIRLDGGTQSREKMDLSRVEEYTEDRRRGDIFPPVIAFYDGTFNWLADGFTRYHVEIALGNDTIRADVRTGTVWDAILFAAGANAGHGQRRTNADRQRQILMVLSNPEWWGKTDRWVSLQVRVDHKTVARVRRDVIEGTLELLCPPVGEFPNSLETSRTGQDGKRYKPKKSKRPAEDDEDSQRDDDQEPDFELPGEEDFTPPPSKPAVDECGVPVPTALQRVWESRWRFAHAARLARELDEVVKAAADSDGGHYLRQRLGGGLCMASVADALDACTPHAVTCRKCRNTRLDCPHCEGRHWDCRP